MAAARADGWLIAAAHAQGTHAPGQEPSSRLTSAGVAVAVPGSLGLERPRGQESCDCSPEGQGGRFLLVWTSACGGMLVGSVYMWTGEGWSSRNVQLMQAVWARLRATDTFWLLGGDRSMGPHLLRQGYWMQQLDPLLVVPDEATHEQSGAW